MIRLRNALILAALSLLTPASLLAQSGVSLASAPTGTTNQTNPEIRVVAPNKVAYKYSLNGSPYSPELSLATPIRLTGTVELAGFPFTAGSSALIDFLKLKTTDPDFTTFLDRIGFTNVESQLQVTYLLNKKRTTVLPDNVLNLQGTGVAGLNVAMEEKIAGGVRHELSALAIDGGRLVQRTSAAGIRQFTLYVPAESQDLAVTPVVNNAQTLITVNGQPSSSGQTSVLAVPAEGQSITIQTVGPDTNLTTYAIEVRYDAALPPTAYKAYFLRAFTPASAYVSIYNAGSSTVHYSLRFNQKFGITSQEIVQEIREMAPEYPGEAIQHKVWRFIRDNRYHADPLTSANWNHAPGLFFNSIGFGYCDDSASVFRHLMTAMGYPSRVWGLNGHVVAEAFVNNRWEMWDPDLQVHYLNREGLVAGVEELAANPDLIVNPAMRLPDAMGVAYEPYVADIYATRSDNGVIAWYDSLPDVGDSSMTFEIPAGATFEFPELYDGPLSSVYATQVPTYTNGRLIVPGGFTGSVRMPLVVQSIGWSNRPTLRVITKDAQGNWDGEPAIATWSVDAESPFTIAMQPSGVFNTLEPVMLKSSEPATVYYTTDGSTPSESSAVYTTPIVMPAGGMLRFFGVDTLGNRGRERVYGAPAVQQVQLRLTDVNAVTATFVASVSGGSGSYEFLFEVRDSLGITSIVQLYSSSNVWVWQKQGVPPGTYSVNVCVRNLGSQGACERSATRDVIIQHEAAPVLVNPGDQVDRNGLRTYSEIVLADGAIGYWRLDEAEGVVVDWASNNPGSRSGTVTRFEPGSLADGTAAAALDGATGYVRIANAPSLQLDGDLTIELWAHVSLSSRQTLISKHYAREFELTLETSGSLNFYQGNGSVVGNVWSAAGAVTSNVWQHIVITRSTSTKTVRFYVNGQAKGTAVYSVDPAAGTGAVTIGRSAAGNQYVNGRLDEVALYSSALTDAQVLKHYAMRLVSGRADAVELPLVASDANGDALTYGADGLPPGLAINSATGLISGSLSETGSGVYPVTATVSDGLLSHSQSFLWTITHVNRAPVLTTPDAQVHGEGAAVSMQVLASDPDNDVLTFSAIGLPPSLSIDPVTGIISGVLSFESSGTHSVIVAVTDGTVSTSATFAWVVTNTNRAPVLTNPGAQTHYARGEYSLAVMRDRPAAYWRFGETSGNVAAENSGRYPGTLAGNVAPGQAGALADGDCAMLFNGVSGYVQAPAVPGLAADLTIELWVKMSIGLRQTLISKDYLREFELTVEPNGGLNFYQGNGVAGGNVQSIGGAVKPNVWQHVVVTRTAATNTIAFYVNAVAKGTGVASVTATTGNAAISIGRAKSGTRYTGGSIDEVAVYPVALDESQIAAHYALAADTSVPTQAGLQLSAFDPDADVLTFSATGLPSGVSIDAATGGISGAPSPAGASIFHVTVTVTDGALSDSESFIWNVERVNQPPALADLPNQTSAEGAAVSLLVSGADADGDVLSYTATGLPAGLTLNPVSGQISGIPSFMSAGEYSVSLAVSDGRLSTGKTLTWIVTNTNRSPVLTNPGARTHVVRSEYAMAVLRDGPAAYWRLGEMGGATAGDIAGSNSAAQIGNVVPGQPGALPDGSRAMLFDGTSGYLQTAAMAGLAADLTIELWVKMSPGPRQTLISKDYLREFELTVEPNGGLNFYQGSGVLSGNVQSVGGAVKPNVWQHVVVTRSAATNTIAFYVNGVAKGTGSASVAATSGNAPISIARAKSGTRYTGGFIDEVALYPRVLTPAQISTHYATSTWTPANEITLQLSATDLDGDHLTYSAAGLPPGLTLHPPTGRISGLVSSEHTGTYQVTVTAADQTVSVSHTFAWTIEQ